MGCGSCGSGGCSSGGCGRSGGCATGGCNKLNTFDWLNNMLPPDRSEADNIYEVRFKNTHKDFFRNVNGLLLYNGDQVVVESDRGYNVGTISLGGVMAQLQMRKKKTRINGEVPRIYRKANENDVDQLRALREREKEDLARARTLVWDLGLNMKLSDIEYQGDGTKAIFYYIADHRVDFRELIKVLAREFRVRVEMRQIGLRHEAGLVGGIGACGRELCCSTWLTEFKTVSTSAARYQNLSLNPMKISGLCGRLKCCLNFELDSYLDALQDFPKIDKINTKKGTAYLQKTDIFKRIMWFSYPSETTWYPLEVAEVVRLVEMPKSEWEKVESLSEVVRTEVDAAEATDFVDVVGQAPLSLPNRRSGNKKRKGRKPRGKNQRGRQHNTGNEQNKQRNSGGNNRRPQNQGKAPQNNRKQGGNRPEGEKPQGNANSRNRNRGKSGNRNRNRGPKPTSDSPPKS